MSQSVSACLTENLPLILLGVGLILVGFIIAAALIVAATASGGTGAAFATAVGLKLAEWWLPITGAVLFNIGIAYQLCATGAPPEIQVSAGAAQGTTAALTLVIVDRRRRRAVKLTRLPSA